MTAEIGTPGKRGEDRRWSNKLIDDSCHIVASYKMNIDEAELLDEYKEKLLAMRIEIIKLKAENQKLESELDTLRRQQKGVSDVK